MKKVLLVLGGILLLLPVLRAQRSCGARELKAAMVARDPSWHARFEAQRTSLQHLANAQKLQYTSAAASRTTAVSDTIPVIFHIILDSAQYITMGRDTGIAKRVDSQIAILNRDFNRMNADSSLIPSGWKPLYASANIHFGLAHTSPTANGTPGYELKIVGTSTFSGSTYGTAKHNISGGLDAWDPTRYLNVWCINFDIPGMLGVTVPKSYTTGGSMPANEVGICATYLSLGCQTSPASLTFPTGGNFSMGRTLTHEMGHFFEIWHTWGDDFGGDCPWTGSHQDDGLADTPPEADYHFGNPAYTITNGTLYDACQDSATVNMQPIGIPCLSFLDYTDDNAMHLFTPDQAAVMSAQVAATGENYSLTQHPELLQWPANTGLHQQMADNHLNLFPNPAMTNISMTFDNAAGDLHEVAVMDVVGREVKHEKTAAGTGSYYSIDLSGMSKGIYLVRCTFASGSITRKILLQ